MWLSLISVLLVSRVSAINGKCRALVLGGSTDKGAYEAGAVIGLINSLPTGEAEWDVVVGTGAGALNGMFLSQYSQGDELSAASALNSFWSSFTTSQFYTDWVGGYVTGLFLQSGLYNSAPMKKVISNISKNPKRFLGVGSTDLITSSYVFFNSSGTSLANLNVGILASAADYFFFPYVKFLNYKLTTGSVKYVVDLYSAINACEGMGYTEDQIVLDIVLGSGKTLETVDASKYKTIQVVLRTFSLMSYYDSKLIIDNARDNLEKVTFRSVINPSQKIKDPFNPYDYSAQELANQLALGQKDAKAAVSIVNEETQ
jgi:hypothetical protein